MSSCGGLTTDRQLSTATPLSLPLLRNTGGENTMKGKKSLWVEIRSSLMKREKKPQRSCGSKRRKIIHPVLGKQGLSTLKKANAFTEFPLSPSFSQILLLSITSYSTEYPSVSLVQLSWLFFSPPSAHPQPAGLWGSRPGDTSPEHS